MKKVRCLIVDDEKQAREGLYLMLRQYEALEVVGVCTNGLEAIRQIGNLTPDLVFLDIQMPQVNGFEVINSLKTPIPAFVFITAHDEYALKAFEIHALDYLLKPFSSQRLDRAIQHALSQLHTATARSSFPVIASPSAAGDSPAALVDKGEFPGKLVVKADSRLYFLEFDSIVWVEAYDYYVKVHTGERYYLVRDSMKNMEDKLPSPAFIRVHKSAIVNTAHVHAIEPLSNNDHLIHLTNQTVVKGSRSYAHLLGRWLG